MGAASRRKPRRLAEKILQIRLALDLSQGGMVSRLGLEDEINRNYISGYERGTREPELHVLLRYARAAGVWMDVLVDDALDLPETLPSTPKQEGIQIKRTTPRARKGER
jgi:transcriptional regulator with XRE-family HTH domain